MKRKYKALFSLLLSVIIVFSAFPAYADDSGTSVVHYYRSTKSSYLTVTKEWNNATSVDYGGTVVDWATSKADSTCYAFEVQSFTIKNNFDDSYISQNDKGNLFVNIKVYDWGANKQHLNGLSLNSKNCFLYNYGGSFKKYTGTVKDGDIKNNSNCSHFNENWSYKEFTVEFKDVEKGNYYFSVQIDNDYRTNDKNSLSYYPDPYQICSDSITYSNSSESSTFYKDIQNKLKGWFDNLFSWLKNISDGISNGFLNVGSWMTNLNNSIKGYFNSLSTSIKVFFSELSTNIKGFFSDLTNSVKTLFTNLTTKLTDFNNNIKTWFKNLGDNLSTWFTNLVNNIKEFLKKVGEWFTTLFEKLGNWFSDLFAKLKKWFEDVGQWFKDLWNNITNKVTEIRTDLHNWWESLFTPEDGFFEAYKTSFDTFFKEHFGILYQVVDFFGSLFNQLTLMLDGGGSGVIEYGELALPAKLFGKKLVILNSGTFSFDNLINSDDSGQLVNISGMIYTVTSVIIYLVLLHRAKKIFEQIITNGEGVED